MEQMELSHTICGNIKWYDYFGTQLGNFLKRETYMDSMSQKMHSYAFTQEKWKDVFIHWLVHECSQELHLLLPKTRNNSSIHQQVNRFRQCGTHMETCKGEPSSPVPETAEEPWNSYSPLACYFFFF